MSLSLPFVSIPTSSKYMDFFKLLQVNMMSYFNSRNSHRHLNTDYFLFFVGLLLYQGEIDILFLLSRKKEGIVEFSGDLVIFLSVSISLRHTHRHKLTHMYAHNMHKTCSAQTHIFRHEGYSFLFGVLWKRELDYFRVRGDGCRYWKLKHGARLSPLNQNRASHRRKKWWFPEWPKGDRTTKFHIFVNNSKNFHPSIWHKRSGVTHLGVIMKVIMSIYLSDYKGE